MLKLVILSGVIFSLLLGSLTTILQQNYETEISPNWFLYTYTDETNIPMSVSLYRANLDTGEKHLITDRLSQNRYGIISLATWSPDGRWIYFKARDKNGRHNLYRQHIHASTPEIIIPNWEVFSSYDSRDYGGEFRWSPDGQWIIHSRVYKDDCDENNICHIAGYVLYRMRLDGSELHRLSNAPTQYEDFAQSVTLSPDKQWLYFKQKGVLYRTALNGQSTEAITTELASGEFKGWSQDNEWMYFATYNTQNAYPLYRLKADGSKLEQLFPVPEDGVVHIYSFTRWFEQDKSLIYVVVGSYYLLDIETGTRKLLLDNHNPPMPPYLSADGQWMMATQFNRGLYRIPVGESTEPEWVIQGDEFFGTWGDDNTFYYRVKENNEMQYYVLDITTFKTTPIDDIEYLRVASGNMFSPDNRYVLVPRWKDLCSRNLKNQHEECLNTVPQNDEFAEYRENFLSWMPPFVDKAWHAHTLLILAGGLIIGCSGLTVYLSRRNLW